MSIGFCRPLSTTCPWWLPLQGMYPLEQYPTGHYFWEFLAYCSGTGGSVLIIGSAAGVAAMGFGKDRILLVSQKISWLALIGYLAGAAVFMLQHYLVA